VRWCGSDSVSSVVTGVGRNAVRNAGIDVGSRQARSRRCSSNVSPPPSSLELGARETTDHRSHDASSSTFHDERCAM
jgi:hypothetical protein